MSAVHKLKTVLNWEAKGKGLKDYFNVSSGHDPRRSTL